MKWRKSGVVVALLALGLGVAACDPGGEDPTTPPTTDGTTTTDPTTEPTETTGPPDIDPPEPPEGMNVDDHQGAALAAGYFLDLYIYMRATGETAQFEAMSGPDCNFCASAVEVTNAIYGNGDWIEGGSLEFSIDEADVVLPTAQQPTYTVQLRATLAPSTVHRADGSAEPVDGDELLLGMGLQFAGGDFLVLGVNVEEA